MSDTNLFHTLVDYVTSSDDGLCLPYSMYSIKSLLLSHGVPLRLHKMNATCCGQVNAAGR